jgi:hypothetical protein
MRNRRESELQGMTPKMHQLMAMRARWVADWLTNTGKIDGERLLISQPQPLNPSYKGASRVNLSLN